MKHLNIHPTHPQPRFIAEAQSTLAKGGLVIAPTETSYVILCAAGHKEANKLIQVIRGAPSSHLYSLMCPTISTVSQYALLQNHAFNFMKQHLPGPYTVVLKADRSVPRTLAGGKRKTVGVRMSAHPVTKALLTAVDDALLCATLSVKDADMPLSSPSDLPHAAKPLVDLVLNVNEIEPEWTTVVDFTDDPAKVLREGAGELADLAPYLGD